MTKKLLRFLAIFASNILGASLIGNPADPALLEEGMWISDCSWASLRAGISADLLFEKRMRPCRVSSDFGISKAEMSWTLAAWDLGWNIKERFDLHLLAGPASSVKLQWLQEGAAYEASGDRGLFWGASSKLVLLEMEDTALGVDFHGGGIQWIEGPLLRNGVPESGTFSSRLYFWQIGAGLSQNLGALKPYVGAATSHLVYVLSPHAGKKLRFHDFLGVGTFEGCTLSLGSRVFLSVEARQFFESGVSLSGEIRF